MLFAFLALVVLTVIAVIIVMVIIMMVIVMVVIVVLIALFVFIAMVPVFAAVVAVIVMGMLVIPSATAGKADECKQEQPFLHCVPHTRVVMVRFIVMLPGAITSPWHGASIRA